MNNTQQTRDTGIVRRVDDLGRIVLPKEVRQKLNINTNDSLEFFVDGDTIILKKYIETNSSRIRSSDASLADFLSEIDKSGRTAQEWYDWLQAKAR